MERVVLKEIGRLLLSEDNKEVKRKRKELMAIAPITLPEEEKEKLRNIMLDKRQSINEHPDMLAVWEKAMAWSRENYESARKEIPVWLQNTFYEI